MALDDDDDDDDDTLKTTIGPDDIKYSTPDIEGVLLGVPAAFS